MPTSVSDVSATPAIIACHASKRSPSRAMCLACIVASPRLLESGARTIKQMRLINALCRFAEMAGEQA